MCVLSNKGYTHALIDLCSCTHTHTHTHSFHSGSIAFGALLIAIIQMLRVLLAYVQKKLKGKVGKVAQALLCLLGACLWCFEKIIRYVNRQAYIEVRSFGLFRCIGMVLMSYRHVDL